MLENHEAGMTDVFVIVVSVLGWDLTPGAVGRLCRASVEIHLRGNGDLDEGEDCGSRKEFPMQTSSSFQAAGRNELFQTL